MGGKATNLDVVSERLYLDNFIGRTTFLGCKIITEDLDGARWRNGISLCKILRNIPDRLGLIYGFRNLVEELSAPVMDDRNAALILIFDELKFGLTADLDMGITLVGLKTFLTFFMVLVIVEPIVDKPLRSQFINILFLQYFTSIFL